MFLRKPRKNISVLLFKIVQGYMQRIILITL